MDLGLQNKIALVAASSKGLGRASAEAIAYEGGKVIICARDETTLNIARKEITAATGAEVLAIPTDLTKTDDIKNLVQRTVEHFGGLHILVTNAGGPPLGYFPDFEDKEWQSAVNLTLMSTVRLIKAALPYMKQAQYGRIINITSISVKEPVDNLVLSNSIRAAVHGLAKTIANQIGTDGITINNVLPGYTLTDRIKELTVVSAKQSGITPNEVITALEDPIPLGRLGQPKEFGAVVAFLASEKASYITGASVPVDGGIIKAAF